MSESKKKWQRLGDVPLGSLCVSKAGEVFVKSRHNSEYDDTLAVEPVNPTAHYCRNALHSTKVRVLDIEHLLVNDVDEDLLFRIDEYKRNEGREQMPAGWVLATEGGASRCCP